MILFQHLCLTIGMFLHALTLTSTGIDLKFAIGISLIILTTLSLPVGFFTMAESHVLLIHKNDKNSLDRMKLFRGSDQEIELEHDSLQSHLIEEEQRKCQFWQRHNILTLLILVLVQNGSTSVSNGLHSYLRLVYMKSYLMDVTEVVAVAARIFGIVGSFAILDLIPRKFQFSATGIAISVILATFGGLVKFQSQIWLPIPFFVAVEFLYGFGMCGIAEILKAEYFPFKERGISTAVAGFVDEGLHVVAVVVMYSWTLGLGRNPTYWTFVFAGILVICCGMVGLTLKDTRGRNWKEASEVYKE